MASTEEKTEAPTPKHKKKVRSEGGISSTPEFGSWLGMLVASFIIPHIGTSLMSQSRVSLVRIGDIIRYPQLPIALSFARQTVESGVRLVLPLAITIMAVGIFSKGAQGGIYFTPKVLKPKFSKFNPFKGMKRLFGPHSLWELAKSLVKTTLVGIVVWMTVRNFVPSLLNSGSIPLMNLVDSAISTALKVVRLTCVAGLVMAAADALVIRRRNTKALKMTKQQVKDEARSSDGDPQIKSQIRSRQIAMTRNRMMAEIPKADVVVLNPTHVAVALKYDPSKGAPRVVAKGADHVATRIRAIAEENRVPMVTDIPLARTLYKTTAVGQEIPVDMFQAVATVLAFIMTLKKRGSAAGVHTVRPLGARK